MYKNTIDEKLVELSSSRLGLSEEERTISVWLTVPNVSEFIGWENTGEAMHKLNPRTIFLVICTIMFSLFTVCLLFVYCLFVVCLLFV